MDREKVGRVKGMSKPSIDNTEDLMAAIIMIWFIDEELMTFDDTQMPESTLVLVEPYLKKPSFEPEQMEKKTGNSACGALCRWVRGVVRYHRMMLSKVKPLHQKALEVRLADLARAFEEATIDKNEQEEKTVKMRKILDTAAQLRREGCAMAAGFATYLGPYHHNFRRVMLTVHWPNCLRERGIPLVIDSVDVLRGRVIDWSINFLKTASGASSVQKMKGNSPHQLQVERISRPVNRAAKPTAAHRAKGIRMLLPPSPVRALKEETRQKGAKEEGAEKTDEEKPVTEGEG
nr:hypothetical protein BaRGS_025625 [Batillaria attramentaria]